jgi:purine-binding chemotaxis protein CheW
MSVTSLPRQLLVFDVGERPCALPLDAVERVVRAVAVTPLPAAPEAVRGVINVRGRVLPVYDLHKRFGLPTRAVGADDSMIIAAAAGRDVALVADGVRGVTEWDGEQAVAPEQIAPGVAGVAGVLKLGEELAVIHDLETFLSPGERAALDAALRRTSQD